MKCPDIKILMACDSHAYVRSTILAGAVGYILDEAPQTVVRAIRTVLQGDTWFSQAIVDKMVQLGISEQLAALTEREMQVLRLVVKGKTNKEIGQTLGISAKAVEKHLSQIFAKLDVPSRAAAAAWAANQGLE